MVGTVKIWGVYKEMPSEISQEKQVGYMDTTRKQSKGFFL